MPRAQLVVDAPADFDQFVDTVGFEIHTALPPHPSGFVLCIGASRGKDSVAAPTPTTADEPLQPSGRYAASNPQTTCPAQYPEAQAHWKLYPPSQPVTSTTSPTKYRPG